MLLSPRARHPPPGLLELELETKDKSRMSVCLSVCLSIGMGNKSGVVVIEERRGRQTTSLRREHRPPIPQGGSLYNNTYQIRITIPVGESSQPRTIHLASTTKTFNNTTERNFDFVKYYPNIEGQYFSTSTLT